MISEEALRERAHFVRSNLPAKGLFAGVEWRISPEPFALGAQTAKEIESLGRVLFQFYRAANLLYRQSVAGKQPEWIAQWLDLGKPAELIEWQRSPAFKNDLPRVIRPDILITDSGLRITELDSVPGGIGLTAWLNRTYSAKLSGSEPQPELIGGAEGMTEGFRDIFGDAARVQIVISEESATYRPEMLWMARELGDRFHVRDGGYSEFAPGDSVYRFFELFDLSNVPSARTLITMAREKQLRLTAPPKPVLEEKMLFALLWNRHLRGFWRQELGEGFFARLRDLIPYSWVVDPAPLPPHAVIPELGLASWLELKTLSQKERDLILKVSGFSDQAWGSRGVHLGSDLPVADWSAAVDRALEGFHRSPYVLQKYYKPKIVPARWHDFGPDRTAAMEGRVRLCPYYFVIGEGDQARPRLGGILATICPADKKIIHGMTDAILAPCSA